MQSHAFWRFVRSILFVDGIGHDNYPEVAKVRRMDAGWVAAIASVATAFIVGVAAIAAVLQIRHIRNANEIVIYLHLIDRLDSAQARVAFDVVETFAAQLKTDDVLRYRLTQRSPVPEFVEIESLLRFLDNLTMLIIAGSITERLILAQYADEIVRMWDSLAEAVYLRRYAIGPHFISAYEHLAMRARAHLQSGEIDRFYRHLRRDPRMAHVAAPSSPTRDAE
jgi:hypothetical protein